MIEVRELQPLKQRLLNSTTEKSIPARETFSGTTISPEYFTVSATSIAVWSSVFIRYFSPLIVSKPVAWTDNSICMPRNVSKSFFIFV